MTKHPVETAFGDPTTADAIKQGLAEGFALTRATAAEIPDLDLTGLTVLELIVDGTIFTYDATDETTAHDGVTCLVSSDGQRFKAALAAARFTNVLDIDNDPPSEPSIGDKYIVGTAPTGDWADNASDLALYNGAEDWVFATPTIGQQVYVRAEKKTYHWSEDAAWDAGIGANTVTDGSIGASKLEFPFGMPVEEETATPAAGTPAAGTKYIIAANATGDWDDEDGNIAEADGAGGWTIHEAYNGATVYDRKLRVLRSYDSSSGEWLSAGGVIVARPNTVISNSTSSTVFGGSSGYTYSGSSAPVASNQRRVDNIGINHEARAAGNPLLIRYRADITLSVDGGWASDAPLVAALWRDSESEAVDWCALPIATVGTTPPFSPIVGIDITFEIPATSGLHSYFVGILGPPGAADCSAMNRRRLSLMEVG